MARTILLSELKFNVTDSIEDNRPVIVVRGPSYEGDVILDNEGWGPVMNPVVHFDVKDPRQCRPQFDTPQDHVIPLQSFADDANFSITRFVSDKMIDNLKKCDKHISGACIGGGCTFSSDVEGIECLDKQPREVCHAVSRPASPEFLRELEADYIHYHTTPGPIEYRRECSPTPICVQGDLEFGPVASRSHVRFITIVYLEQPGAGAPAPPSYTYDVYLEAGKKNYVMRKAISQAIKPGDVDNFLVKIATHRSARFNFGMEILDASGTVAWGGKFDMSLFVPKSGASLAFRVGISGRTP